MRTIHRLAVVATTLFFGACFQSTAVVKINADGSGTIHHRTMIASAVLNQLRQFAGSFGGGAKPIDFFSEEEARGSAAKMGEGIRLLSTAPLKTAAAEGRENLYEFLDVTKLRFDELLSTGNGGGRQGAAGIGPDRGVSISADFARSSDGNAVLTLHGPPPAALGNGGLIVNDRNIAGAEQLAAMRQALAGMRISLQVEPSGRLVRTSSAYADGNTVTLFDLDVDEMLKDETVITRLQSVKTTDEMIEMLKHIPGLKAQPGDVTIEFTSTR